MIWHRTIICDESHALKNKDTKQTQLITRCSNPAWGGARRVILITGGWGGLLHASCGA